MSSKAGERFLNGPIRDPRTSPLNRVLNVRYENLARQRRAEEWSLSSAEETGNRIEENKTSRSVNVREFDNTPLLNTPISKRRYFVKKPLNLKKKPVSYEDMVSVDQSPGEPSEKKERCHGVGTTAGDNSAQMINHNTDETTLGIVSNFPEETFVSHEEGRTRKVSSIEEPVQFQESVGHKESTEEYLKLISEITISETGHEIYNNATEDIDTAADDKKSENKLSNDVISFLQARKDWDSFKNNNAPKNFFKRLELSVRTNANDEMKIFNEIGKKFEPKNDEPVYSEIKNSLTAIFKNHNICCGLFYAKEPITCCTGCSMYYHYKCRELKFNEGKSTTECECQKSEILTGKFAAIDLPPTFLSKYMEKVVNTRKKSSREVIIREVYSEKIQEEFGENVKKLYKTSGKAVPVIEYKDRIFTVYIKVRNCPINIFSLQVQEYKMGKKVYIGYLDSVMFIKDTTERGQLYRSVLLAYFDFIRNIGYEDVQIYSQAPESNKKKYMFNGCPKTQRLISQTHLRGWYDRMLREGIEEKIVASYTHTYNIKPDADVFSLIEYLYCIGGSWWKKLERLITSNKEIDFNASKSDVFLKKIGDMVKVEDEKLYHVNLCCPTGPLMKFEDNYEIGSISEEPDDDWLQYQKRNGLNFETDISAMFASAVMVQAVLRKQEETAAKNDQDVVKTASF
ncbi:hypothetical protein GCK72_025992 [Caenorhabditis remanei]|uniref:histone acetyltransferase n=1 Tax=Caenorhabditis remanei TaxID=31234 RepID=A0A6A5G4L4_CAERE|nr:hypothetical protein GCK72_025992 [Caenorhabditis remanei]KAF1749524.1 hypothetical protein GCK72_025992 [Caenorhabditis remanei]